MKTGLIERVRAVALSDGGAGVGDGELLGRFVESGDGAALAALVGRHGPMVWGTCRRLLGHHDAEDAFQATWIVFAKKAPCVAPREAVANWLYGVARQAALQARRAAARRKAREARAARPADAAHEPPDEWADVRAVLDEELGRLPDDYRAAVVLCDLEGRSRREAAGLLGCPEGTLAGRLARARRLLAKRLARRGVTPPGDVLPRDTACVPAVLMASAALAASGRAAASAGTVALAGGVMKAMSMSKFAPALAAALLMGLAAVGAAAVAGRVPGSRRADVPADARAKAPAPRKEERVKEKEPLTAWGEAVGGLKAGLGLKAGEKRAYRHGEPVSLVVRVRNVGKEPVTFEYVPQHLDERPPTVTDAEGKPVANYGLAMLGMHGPVKVTLKPGEEVELRSRMFGTAGRKYDLRPPGWVGKRESEGWPLFAKQGRVGLRCERVLGNSSSGFVELPPGLEGLATGRLDLEVLPAEEKKE